MAEDNQACKTSDADIALRFLRDLQDPTAQVHVNRVNALGAYDTTSYGTHSRMVIANAISIGMAELFPR